jgi:tetratricopeptide (TPR) repeat protein
MTRLFDGISAAKCAAAATALVWVAGCGGAAPPAQSPEPPPPIGSSSAPAASSAPSVERASSPKVQEGIDAIQSKDFAKARTVLTEARAEHPNDPQAAFYLGVALEGLGEGRKATQQYKQALALDPKLTEATVNLSALLLDENDPKGALAAARQGLAVAPKHPGLLMNQALALEATGDKAAAAKAYGEAVAAQPNNVDLRYAHAELLAETGQKDAAIAELGKIMTDDAKLALAIGILYGKLGDFGQCDSILGRLASRHPTPEVYVSRGRCRHAQKNLEGEQADYMAALGIDDKFAPAHFFLGELYRDAGKKKQALAELDKAAKLGGNSEVGKAAEKAASEIRGKKPHGH